MKTKRKQLKTLIEMYSEQRLGDDSYTENSESCDIDDDAVEAEIGLLETLADQKSRLKKACAEFEKRCKAKRLENK